MARLPATGASWGFLQLLPGHVLSSRPFAVRSWTRVRRTCPCTELLNQGAATWARPPRLQGLASVGNFRSLGVSSSLCVRSVQPQTGLWSRGRGILPTAAVRSWDSGPVLVKGQHRCPIRKVRNGSSLPGFGDLGCVRLTEPELSRGQQGSRRTGKVSQDTGNAQGLSWDVSP